MPIYFFNSALDIFDFLLVYEKIILKWIYDIFVILYIVYFITFLWYYFVFSSKEPYVNKWYYKADEGN